METLTMTLGPLSKHPWTKSPTKSPSESFQPESFADMNFIAELDKSGYIDSLYKINAINFWIRQ